MGNNELTGVIYSILVEKTKGTLLRNWDDLDLWMLAESVEGSVCQQPIELNKNQQIVLEWLKDRTTVSSITSVLWLLLDDALEVDYDTDGSEAWNRLTIDQKFQVLAAFAEWGMKEVAE